MTIGERIAKSRKDKNFTQEYVAEQLGVSRQAVSKWENDLTSPDTYNLIKLAQLLDVSVEYIACGTKNDENQNVNIKKQIEVKPAENTSKKQKPLWLNILGVFMFGIPCCILLALILFMRGAFLLLSLEGILLLSPLIISMIIGWKMMF